MTLEQAKLAIGRKVRYLPALRLNGKVEIGEITSVNDTFVFVRYTFSGHSAATRPEDVEVIGSAPGREGR